MRTPSPRSAKPRAVRKPIRERALADAAQIDLEDYLRELVSRESGSCAH